MINEFLRYGGKQANKLNKHASFFAQERQKPKCHSILEKKKEQAELNGYSNVLVCMPPSVFSIFVFPVGPLTLTFDL